MPSIMEVSSPEPSLNVVLPVALTQLYFKSLALWPSGFEQNMGYNCAFEDDPEKAAQLRPDLTISVFAVPAGFRALEEDKIHVKRLIVASPKLLRQTRITKPIDLEQFPYATLSRLDCKYFYVTTPRGDTMVIEPRESFNANDPFAAHEAARLGIAFAVLPEWMVLDDLDSGALISLLPSWPPQTHIIRVRISRQCTYPAETRALAKLMLEKLKNIQGIEVRN